MMMTRPGSLLVIEMIVALCVFGGATPSFGYIGGIPVGDQFGSAVLINSVQTSCSSVKVADHFLLTAAHCNLFHGLDPGKEVYLIDSTGMQSDGHYEKVTIKDLHVHSSWLGVNVGDNELVDLAVVEFADALSMFPSTKISTTSVNNHDAVVVGGFGCKGDGYPDRPNFTAALKEVEDIFGLHFAVGIEDFESQTLSFGCEGDSGSPVYRKISDTGDYEVVGINHAVSLDESQITVDPETGEIVKYQGNHPSFSMMRLNYINDDHSIDVSGWFKNILPAEAFSGEEK